MVDSHVVLIGGRSGVGKSTAAYALHDLLAGRDIRHALIEGDLLDLAHPAPWRHGLAERNLRAIWANYRDLGYRRLIYTNTLAVLEAPTLTAAMDDSPRVTAVLLRAGHDTIACRLEEREHGESLQRHLARSTAAATRLDVSAPASVHRLDTDGLSPETVAERILALTGWDRPAG